MITAFTLPNGLKVNICERPNTNRVRTQILYEFGSGVEESRAERGLAHATEHLIFKGTKRNVNYSTNQIQSKLPTLELSKDDLISRDDLEQKIQDSSLETMSSLTKFGAVYLSEGDIDSIGRKYGASLNAYTSLQRTSYFFEMSKGNEIPFLQILSNSAQNANFQDDHINSEIKAVLQEMKMGDDNNIRMAIQKSMEMMFGVNEMGHLSTIGSELDLMHLNASVVQSFYDKHYHPWNSTLFVVGDVVTSEIKAVIEEYFGHIKLKLSQLRHEIHKMEEIVYTAERPSKTTLVNSLTTLKCQVDGLSNRSLRTVWHRKIDDMQNALDNESTKSPASLGKVLPPPSNNHFVLYRPSPTQQTYVFSARFPPTSQTHFNALITILNTGDHSRFQQDLIQSNLAADVSCFSDNYSHASLFYIVVLQPKIPLSQLKTALFKSLTKEFKDTEITKANAYLRFKWCTVQEEISTFTNEWIDSYVESKDPLKILQCPTTEKKELVQIQKRFNLQMLNLVEIKPFETEHKVAIQSFNDRKLQRDLNAKKIMLIKNRVSELEKPYSMSFFPDPIPCENCSMPKLENSTPTEWKSDLILYHSNTKLLHVRCTPPYNYDHLHSLQNATFQLGMKLLQKEHDTSTFEQHGTDLSFGNNGAFLTLSNDNPERIGLTQNFLSLFKTSISDPLSSEERFHQERDLQIVSALQSKESAVFLAMEQLSNTYLRSNPYSIDDLIQHYKSLTLKDVNDLIASTQFNTTIIQPGTPREEGFDVSGERNTPSNTGEKKQIVEQFTPVHVPLNRTQTVVCLSRKGQHNTSDPFHCMKINGLLYHIVYYSLGSRVYDIRKKFGYFYGAQGNFGVGSDATHLGFDYVLTRVEKENINPVLSAFKNLFHQLKTDPQITSIELNAACRWYENQWSQISSQISSSVSSIHSMKIKYPNYNWQTLPSKLLKEMKQVSVQEMNDLAKKHFQEPFSFQITIGN